MAFARAEAFCQAGLVSCAGCQSLRSLRAYDGSPAVDKTTLLGPARNSRRRLTPVMDVTDAASEWRRLVDQHDRDVVAHRVAEAASGAHEYGFIRPIVEVALAFRADEYGEQLWVECHVVRS